MDSCLYNHNTIDERFYTASTSVSTVAALRISEGQPEVGRWVGEARVRKEGQCGWWVGWCCCD